MELFDPCERGDASMSWYGDVFRALRKFDGLMEVEQKHGDMIRALEER